MKKIYLLLIALLWFTTITSNAYVILYPGAEFYGGNIILSVSNSDGINLSYLEVGNNYIILDDYNLSITSANTININLSQVNDPPVEGEISILRFNATYTSGNVDFVFSTDTSYPYRLYMDNVYVSSHIGNFSWSYDSWASKHDFDIKITNGNVQIRCYNESNPSQAIPYDLEISNKEGTQVYKRTGISGVHSINITDIPYGDDTVFIVDSPGYKQRIYYKDIDLYVASYNFSFYLPPSTTQSEPNNDTTGCTLRSYINSINISNYTVDATITFSQTLDEVITVEVYNQSLFGSYGGWIMIPENKYTVGSSSVIINQTVLDVNTSMARVTYYYIYCPNEIIDTPLYSLRVVETITTEYTSYDKGVEGAILTIKRYANTTGVYVDVASLLTDANGYCNAYLLPNILYKVNITKDLYISSISDYIPAPASQYGQTVEKVFRIVYDAEAATPDSPVLDYYYTNIVFTATMLNNNSIYIVYNDINLSTVNVTIRIYDNYEGLMVINHTYNSSSNSFSYYITGINTTHQYVVVIWFNNTADFCDETSPVTHLLFPIDTWTTNTKFNFNDRVTNLIGPIELGSWAVIASIILPIIVLVSLSPFNVGAAIIGSGISLGFMQGLFAIWFTDGFSPLLVVMVPVMIFIGFMYIMSKGRGADQL